MWLYPLNNSLKIVTSTSDVSGVESCDIANIPLMTWVHIVYVLNNRTVDIYINGKLERSCALRGIPKITNDPVYMSAVSTSSPTTKDNNNDSSKSKQQAGFYGKIGKTQYFVKALLPNDVANLYQQGPLGKSQYQLQFFDKEKSKKESPSDSIAGNDSKKTND